MVRFSTALGVFGFLASVASGQVEPLLRTATYVRSVFSCSRSSEQIAADPRMLESSVSKLFPDGMPKAKIMSLCKNLLVAPSEGIEVRILDDDPESLAVFIEAKSDSVDAGIMIVYNFRSGRLHERRYSNFLTLKK